MSVVEMTSRLNRSRHSGLIVSLIASVLEWNDLRVTRKALAKLSDRELDDIGLTRFDLNRLR
ncbi:hypothetical protein DT23_10560 [Thioclava indica]|uniref:YjiS-like domain-containing protein n=2 Tax=Thioclava indica TaxID=1353528 RepID=A0A074KHZ9_9RHOB|nr:DUF1127 domain-containing protein [Thioclava indica]KEO61167.1 hypothetical protein DT23_10560 [Thioclava indica]